MKTKLNATIVFDPIDIESDRKEVTYLIVETETGKAIVYAINKLDYIDNWSSVDAAYCEVNRLIDQERYAKHYCS